MWFLLFLSLIMLILLMVFVLQSVAFVTLYERHLLGSSQNRLGPTKVSFMGFLQALLDGLKLIKKEQILPLFISDMAFLFVPGVAFVVMYLEWFILPYMFEFISLEYSLLFFFCLLGFSVYSTMISGYISKSKYGVLGALRASSQSVSYEIVFSIFMLSLILMLGLFMFKSVFCLVSVVFYLPFLIMVIAELNRAPFDFAEGESELVSGYNVEFGSVSFVLLFLSEYGSLIFFSLLWAVLFFDFSLFLSFLIFSLMIFIRSSYPRFRYDMLMEVFWFKLLPVSLLLLFFFYFLYVY